MSEEKRQERRKRESKRKKPDTQIGKDATDEQVKREEETGGALPQNRSDGS